MTQRDIKEYHDLAFREKANFLAFINKLGESGLKKLFKFPGENFSLWWFSLVAERSSYKSESYNKLISLLLSEETGPAGKARPRGSLRNSLFFQFIMGLCEIVRFSSRIARIKLALIGMGSKKKNLSDSEFTLVSYFPLIDEDALKDDIFINQYMAPFHKILEKEKAGKYSHILIQVFLNKRYLKDAVILRRKFGSKQSLFFIEEFFKIKHIFLFIFYYSYFLLKFVLNLHVINKLAVYEHNGSKRDVWHIIKGDFYKSFCGPAFVKSIGYTLLFKEAVRLMKNRTKILTTCEMQWWEKPLYIYARDKGLTTIGYQHTIIPELLLNYFNTEQEMEGRDFVKNAPLPDYMATVGNTVAGLLKRNGWPGERVFIWGAQRFNELKNMKGNAISWADRDDYIVVAFSIDTNETKKILAMLSMAVDGNAKYKLVLKGHPTQDLPKIVQRLGVNLPSEKFEYAEGGLAEIMRKAKGIIVTESSSTFYALAQGIPIIIPRFSDKVDCNPISYITDVPVYVYSPGELAYACEKAVSSKPSAEYAAKCMKIFDDYLYFPKNDSEYYEKIVAL